MLTTGARFYPPTNVRSNDGYHVAPREDNPCPQEFYHILEDVAFAAVTNLRRTGTICRDTVEVCFKEDRGGKEGVRLLGEKSPEETLGWFCLGLFRTLVVADDLPSDLTNG